jgi:hypothetical protein
MLHDAATLHIECPVTGEHIELEIGLDGPSPGTPWFVHFAKPAVQWWDDVVDT